MIAMAFNLMPTKGKNTNEMKKGFTLIELLMVIAIVAIISTLAVSKVGGVKEAAARKVSLANQKAVERAVSSFLVAGGFLNRLDNLIYADCSADAEQGGQVSSGDRIDFTPQTINEKTLYLGPSDLGTLDPAFVAEKNEGLHPSLRELLCLYNLNDSEAKAFSEKLGLKYVVRHYEKAQGYPSFSGYSRGDDGTVPGASDGLDPDYAACITKSMTNGLLVAAISPASHLGRTIYQTLGEEYLSTKNWNEVYAESDVRSEVDSKGGLLIAFGLNDLCSIIGNANAGLESVPYSTYIHKKYYSRYILLFRLRKIGAGSIETIIPEFAGVLDCCGNTVRAAQMAIKNL